jgi:hypothetical protein
MLSAGQVFGALCSAVLFGKIIPFSVPPADAFGFRQAETLPGV